MSRSMSSVVGSCFLGFALLFAIGLAAPDLACAFPDLILNPSSLNFGTVSVGTTSPSQTEFAANSSSTQDITFKSISTSSPFIIVGDTCSPKELKTGQTCHIDVVCKPITAGTFNATLSFFYVPGKITTTVPLTCNTIEATPTPTPTATPTPTVNISGTAIQNGMSGATITAVSVNTDGTDGATLGTATTDSNGNFSIVAPVVQSPVRLRASGGSYVSEENGTTIGSPSPLSVLLPAVQNNLSGLSINPLTTFVDSLAQGNISHGQNVATALGNSTLSIERDYGISTDPSTLAPLYTSAAVGTDAGRLGLILGAIVNEDQLACPGNGAGGLVAALSSDISDGVFDGMNSGTPVSYCGGNLPAIGGTAQFSDALSGLQQLTLTTSGFTFGGTLNQLTLNSETAADEAGDAATIESALTAATPASVNTFATTTPSMNAARDNSTATVLPNGLVLIAGGQNGSGALSSTELYNPATDTFAATTPSMKAARAGATATLLPNGIVLIAGGADPFSPLNSTELYSPVSNTFAASTPFMNSAHAGATATLLPNGMVLIAGGIGAGPTSSTELYNPATNTFAFPSPAMNVARFAATAALLPNGKVLIAGGVGVDYLSSTELYDPVSNTFAAAASTPVMNTPRRSATATLLPNGKVLIAGGWNTNAHIDLSSTELYDPVTNTFAASASTPLMNTARDQAAAALLPNGKVLIAGGEAIGAIFSSTELYDPATNTFAAAASTPVMNTAREFTSAIVLLPNGKLLIAGGYDNAFLSSVELYTP